ncbi:hypothetical protein MHYP_G00266470 [Metynnis hypsauchen]
MSSKVGAGLYQAVPHVLKLTGRRWLAKRPISGRGAERQPITGLLELRRPISSGEAVTARQRGFTRDTRGPRRRAPEA